MVLPRKCTTLTTQVSLTFGVKMGDFRVKRICLNSNMLIIKAIQNGQFSRIWRCYQSSFRITKIWRGLIVILLYRLPDKILSSLDAVHTCRVRLRRIRAVHKRTKCRACAGAALVAVRKANASWYMTDGNNGIFIFNGRQQRHICFITDGHKGRTLQSYDTLAAWREFFTSSAVE